jgi:VIT1/CCC1 family predicted Fe2+/Mn2+ transporter
MFGVIMVVCFTSVIRIHPIFWEQYIDSIIASALACCIAWGLVDGIFYTWEAHYEARKKNDMISSAKLAVDENLTSEVDEAFDDSLADYLDDEQRKQLVDQVTARLASAEKVKVPKTQDFATIGIAMLLVVGSAIVVIIPFYLVEDIMNALLLSNLAGIGLLFFMGIWREESKRITKKLTTGFVTAFVAVIITFVTVALGG